MCGNILQKIKLISEINGSISIHWLHEYYPELLDEILKKYGSLEKAISLVGINYQAFISGYYPESSKSLNTEFFNTMKEILREYQLIIKNQEIIKFHEQLFNPVCIDQFQCWYILKILPFSNLTKYIIVKIREHSFNKIKIIYLKKTDILPKITSTEFIHVNEFLTTKVLDERLINNINSLSACLNYVKFVI